ncbi:hypothetical protein BDZ97DRAFT_1755345 [Flammula alnicola]|nr:hypothetical protein BDZ97DRAFT_1755345 [Flammula alnicola]
MSSTTSSFAPFSLTAYNNNMTSPPRRNSETSQLAGPKNIVYANTQILRSTMPFTYTKYDPSEPVVDLDRFELDTLSSDEGSREAMDHNNALGFLLLSSMSYPREYHIKSLSLLEDPAIRAELHSFVHSNTWAINPAKLAEFSQKTMIPAAAEKYLRHIVVDEEMPRGLKKYLELELCLGFSTRSRKESSRLQELPINIGGSDTSGFD